MPESALRIEKTAKGLFVRAGRKKYKIIFPKGEKISERQLIKFLIQRFHRKRRKRNHARQNQEIKADGSTSSGLGNVDDDFKAKKFDLYNRLEEKLKEKPPAQITIQGPPQLP